jgi:hypothetical protein
MREYEQYISALVRWRTPVTVDQVHEILRPIDSADAEGWVEGIATIRSELATRAIEVVEPTPCHPHIKHERTLLMTAET